MVKVGWRRPLGERLLYDIVGDCWEWTKCRNPTNYGLINIDGSSRLAHRVAYSHWVEPIPASTHVLHKCDNPPCINPEHLYLGTQQDNVRDRMVRGRQSYGLDNGSGRIPIEIINEIRNSPERGIDISRRLGVSESYVSELRNDNMHRQYA